MLNHSMDNAFLSNRVNSWLKDRKEKTELNIKKRLRLGKNELYLRIFRYASVLSNDPKPLKQYTLFKKDYPFRFPSLLTIGSTNRKLTYMCLQ